MILYNCYFKICQ